MKAEWYSHDTFIGVSVPMGSVNYGLSENPESPAELGATNYLE